MTEKHDAHIKRWVVEHPIRYLARVEATGNGDVWELALASMATHIRYGFVFPREKPKRLTWRNRLTGVILKMLGGR